MSKIDTTKWKQFKIYELFHTERSGKKMRTPTGASLRKVDLIDGEVPRITVIGTNNGILGYFNIKSPNSNYRIFENFISVSFLGTVFYQQGKASLDMKVHCLKLINKELNKYIGQYLVTCIKKSLKESKYSDQISSTVLPKLVIKLPVDDTGNPDYLYMEEHMKKLEKYVKDSYSKLQFVRSNVKFTNFNILKWKEFEIREIFPEKIIKPTVYHTREVEQNENGIPYIVRSKFNNGIKCRVIRPKDNVNPSGVISFGAENATFFYQKEEWISGRDIYYIDTQGIDEYACLFITACLQQIAYKYSYNYGLFPKLLESEKIQLPVDKNGKPDYQHMSDYMKKLEIKFLDNIRFLKTIK